MTNPDIAAILDEIADLLEFKGSNPFRIRAYRNAARTVHDLPESVAQIVAQIAADTDRRLTDIKGIGKDLAEKISTRAGWNFASPDEHWASGYQHEMQDFCECIAQDREPLSGWTLARDVVAVIYAAYVSAEEGRRVEVPLD